MVTNIKAKKVLQAFKTIVDGTVFIPYLHQKLLPPLQLELIQGGEVGKVYNISPGRHSFGRDSQNSIWIDVRSISRFHGTLQYDQIGKITLFDDSSTNGISLEGKTAPVIQLSVGQVVQIAGAYLRLKQVKKIQWLPKMEIFKNPEILAASISLLLLVTLFAFIPSRKKEIAQVQPRGVLPLVEHRAAYRKPTRSVPRRASYDSSALLLKARAARDKQQYKAAKYLWSIVLKNDPTNSEALNGMAELDLIASQMIEEAQMLRLSSPTEAANALKLAASIAKEGSPVRSRAEQVLTEWRKS